MLWYKAWLETRTRFLISLVGIIVLCSLLIYHGDRDALPNTGPSYYYFVLRSGHAALCTMWILAVTLLTMGGLLREKAIGAASFTLALPAGRTRLMSVRICMGFLQAFALAVLPWAAMFAVAVSTGKARSIGQAGFHIALLAGGGMLFFGIALLVSSLVEGEYTAPVVSFGVTLAMSFLLGDPPLRAYSPFAFINGVEYWDRHSGLLVGAVPWAHIAASIGVTCVLIAISVKAIQRREF